MLKMFRRKHKAAYRRWARSRILIELNKHDRITLGDAYENIVIFGGVGSGKTSGSSFAICKALLEIGAAGVFLTAKPGDAKRIRRLCELTGRSEDLLVIDDSGKYHFSFLDHTLRVLGRGGAAIENLVATLWAVMKVAERATGSQPSTGGEAFFDHGIRRHARSVVALPIYAIDQISVSHMLEVMRELPRTPAEANSPTWRKDSIICHLLEMARAKAGEDAALLHDIGQIEAYFLREFPAIAERTRSIFEAGLFGILDLLSRGSLFQVFGRETDVTPEMCLEGRVLVIDWPTATHGPIGLIAQTLFKLAFQRMVQQRSMDGDDQPLFFVADEFQTLVTDSDYQHCAISRESCCVNVLITQSIASLRAVLATNPSGEAAVDALLGLASLKFFHSNGDSVTNAWASEVIGRRWMQKRSLSINHQPRRIIDIFPEQPGFSTSSDQIADYAVLPHVFTSLLRGGPPKMQTEAILFANGRVFKATQDTYLRVIFNQGF